VWDNGVWNLGCVSTCTSEDLKVKILAIPIPSMANIEDYMAWSSSMQACISPTWLILG